MQQMSGNKINLSQNCVFFSFDVLYSIIPETHFFFQVLKEDITPTLTKLREERSSYLEYQKIIRELEHLNKLYIAYQFVRAEVSSW